MIKIKRVYESASKSDGHRALVDRVWPRGMSRESARIHEWLSDVAPSRSAPLVRARLNAMERVLPPLLW